MTQILSSEHNFYLHVKDMLPVETLEIPEDDYTSDKSVFGSIPKGQVLDFAREVKRKMPWVSFYRDHKYRTDKLWVYDENPLPLGWIGYGHFTDTGDKQHFVVCAPSVRNGKYKHTDQKYMAMTTSFNKALKNASAHLRGWTTGEMARVGLYRLRKEREKIVEQAKNDLRETKRSMGFSGLESSTSTVSAYRTFKSLLPHIPEGEVLSNLRKAMQLEQEIAGDNAMNTTATFVCIKKNTDGEIGLYTVPIPQDIVNNTSEKYGPKWNNTVPEFYQSEIVWEKSPEHVDKFKELAGFINRLTVLEERTYVRGVGMKWTEDMFYVHNYK